MRVLVTWGTKRGGTEGIGRMIGEVLRGEGFDVTTVAASDVNDLAAYDAAIVGGALYLNRWHRSARRLVVQNAAALRRIPVWLFSSGPLDDSADREEIPPTAQVSVLLDRIGARGHETFGGRLTPDAKGVPAAALARTRSGDWRNPDRIRAWAVELARAIPLARPRAAIDSPARSVRRLVAHAALGWVLFAGIVGGLLDVTSLAVAKALLVIAAPALFTAIAVHYFHARGAREPLPTALVMVSLVALLDALIVAGVAQGGFEMFGNFAATWLPYLLIFLAVWMTGLLRSILPWREAAVGSPSASHGPAPVRSARLSETLIPSAIRRRR
jgi:menaquinone-dependent protoporphyrinogen oxidase